MIKKYAVFLICVLSTLNLSAQDDVKKFKSEFSTGNAKWTGAFACYNVGEEEFFELAWGWDTLPKPLEGKNGILTKGMYLSGNNHSDDLFMFLKRPVCGLKPNTRYDVTFHVTIENNVPPGQVGVGGSPGEDVFFKVGASRIEPKKVNVNGFYRLNVDKGSQSESGRNALVVGNLANPLVDPNDPQFEPKSFSSDRPLRIRTDENGRLWVFVGTDSGFEGPTLYYIAKIGVRLEEQR